MTTSNLITAPCPNCGTPVEFEPCPVLRGIVPICDPCADVQQAKIDKEASERVWRLAKSKLPDDYHKAVPEQVPMWFADALRWRAADHPSGLGLIGPTGQGKSCTIACLLMQMKERFLWWSGTQARDAAIRAATAERDRAAARAEWDYAMRVPLLVLDDISQGKMTEAWSAHLFDLLETRISSRLPTLWTSQIDMPALREKIFNQNNRDQAQAEAITRRLAQHSRVLKMS